jgi:hypothetical protein
MMVFWHCCQSLARLGDGDNGGDADNGALATLAIPACSLEDGNGSGGSADNSALALSAAPHLLMQQKWWWQRCQ